jgi:uncharacterized protein YjbI with pentapeptide repeats
MKKTKIEIKNIDGDVIFTHEEEDNSIRKTLELAVINGVSLIGADLSNANLKGANLSGADILIYIVLI